MMRILLVVAILAISACATHEGYEKVLNLWIGETEEHLVSKWGIPVQVYELNGTRYLKYFESATFTSPGSLPSYTTTTIGRTTYIDSVGGSLPSSETYTCETTFTIKDGLVAAWAYQGVRCRSM